MAPDPKKLAKEVQRLQAAAQKHVDKGRLDKALAIYQELTRLEPKRIKHWLTIGYLEGKRGNVQAAADIYRKVGNYYAGHGEPEKAIAVLRQVLSPCPRDVGVHLRLAELQQKVNRQVEAWQHCRAALALLLEDGRQVDAVQVLVAMTEMQSDNVALWIRLAETAVSAGMMERAAEAFTTAMEQLRTAGRTGEYVKVAERLSGLWPDDLSVVRELGAAYLRQGDLGAALERFQRCIEAAPQDARTLEMLVDAFLEQGDADKAITALRLLADAYLDRGEMAQHELTCRRLLELDPSLSPVVESIPAAVVGSGRINVDTASRSVDPSLVEADAGTPAEGGPPRSEEVTALLKEAVGYMQIGLYDGAADVLRQARTLAPADEELFEQLKVTYVKLGAVDETVELLVDFAEQVVDATPERAAALLDEALELNADHPAVFKARMGPLDPDAMEAKARAARAKPSGKRWSDRSTSLKLRHDLTAVTVKQPMPPDVTRKIDVDALEQTLLEDERHEPTTGRRKGPAAERPNPFEEPSARTSRPVVLQPAGTGEIDLLELRRALGTDEEGSGPTPTGEENGFRPEVTSPNALALSERWKHLQKPDDPQ